METVSDTNNLFAGLIILHNEMNPSLMYIPFIIFLPTEIQIQTVKSVFSSVMFYISMCVSQT